ncbi:MAG: adenylosuccinate synthetase [Lachnospiraceae bacterium]|nr:adenylosuccinate synthetase [Lachnospiraceae bacterium]
MNIRAVIGKGFGDEGKGLATDYFCSKSPGTLVIKHNGGAQAGHTVETPGKRFVFHQLSAGSFRMADTFWADSYYPDLYKLGEEVEEFNTLTGICPKIYCDPGTCVTIIDDILINMLLEMSRGDKRHGSCGMGINECDLRTGAGFGITVEEVLGTGEEDLLKKLLELREGYTRLRLSHLGIDGKSLSSEAQELYDMLGASDVLSNWIIEAQKNAEKNVSICGDVSGLLTSRQQVLFETGQGLLLDSENEEYAPHVTASRTGLYNPCRILKKYGLELSEAVYITRSYVTRHGAGHLPYECTPAEIGITTPDITNVHNPWQGDIRYAKHPGAEEFVRPVLEDLDECGIEKTKASLFITHLNETDGKILTGEGDITVEEFVSIPVIQETFANIYKSYSRINRECDD